MVKFPLYIKHRLYQYISKIGNDVVPSLKNSHKLNYKGYVTGDD